MLLQISGSEMRAINLAQWQRRGGPLSLTLQMALPKQPPLGECSTLWHSAPSNPY
jgi:hypothetical protein